MVALYTDMREKHVNDGMERGGTHATKQLVRVRKGQGGAGKE